MANPISIYQGKQAESLLKDSNFIDNWNRLHETCEWDTALIEKLKIESATTCDTGLNYYDTPKLGLKRFLDGENINQIVFESELYGFNELLRIVRKELFRK